MGSTVAFTVFLLTIGFARRETRPQSLLARAVDCRHPLVPETERNPAEDGPALLRLELGQRERQRLAQILRVDARDQLVDRRRVVRDRSNPEPASRPAVDRVATLVVAQQVSRHRPKPWPRRAIGRELHAVPAFQGEREGLLRDVKGELAAADPGKRRQKPRQVPVVQHTDRVGITSASAKCLGIRQLVVHGT
jgi:hypothetical protein